jgi:hypothetical protein
LKGKASSSEGLEHLTLPSQGKNIKSSLLSIFLFYWAFAFTQFIIDKYHAIKVGISTILLNFRYEQGGKNNGTV